MSVGVAGDAPGAWPEELEIGFFAESSMTLPGEGDRGAGCGEWYPSEFCDECGEPHFGQSRCEQRTCPDCWGAWRRRRSEKIARRLGAARYAAEEGVSKRAVHAVVSPPEGDVRTLSDVSRGFRDAYRLAEDKGVRGGVSIFHGFRVLAAVKEEFEAADFDGGLWAFVREHERDWRSLTYWSPHYHILGLARDFEANAPDEQGGWVAERLRTLDSFQLHDSGGYEDMVGASMYLLSHAAFESGTSKDCVRWFGELATTKFSPEEELSEGSLSVVERMAAEAASVAPERAGGGGEEEEREPCDNCGARSRSPIWDAGYALQDPGWCDRIGREQQRRLTVAFEWRIGERHPPPGLRGPRSEEESKEVFEQLVEAY